MSHVTANPGFLVVDKPPGLTSHDVVAMVRAVTGIKKVGHTGTLDPFATGVLPLALGSATRLIQYLDENLKVYDGVVALGSATDTADPTGEVIEEAPVPPLERDHVLAVLNGFRGVRMQRPPKYSAVKVNGKRLYRYARQGLDVEIPARPVRIDSVELVSLGTDQLRIRIECGRGTYARVLAEEIAAELGTVGHLRSLRRLRSGPFGEDGALQLDALSQIVAGCSDWQQVLRRPKDGERVPWNSRESVLSGLASWRLEPLAVLSHLPLVVVQPDERRRVCNGGAPPPPSLPVPVGEHYLAVDDKQVLCVVRTTEQGPRTVWRRPTN